MVIPTNCLGVYVFCKTPNTHQLPPSSLGAPSPERTWVKACSAAISSFSFSFTADPSQLQAPILLETSSPSRCRLSVLLPMNDSETITTSYDCSCLSGPPQAPARTVRTAPHPPAPVGQLADPLSIRVWAYLRYRRLAVRGEGSQLLANRLEPRRTHDVG